MAEKPEQLVADTFGCLANFLGSYRAVADESSRDSLLESLVGLREFLSIGKLFGGAFGMAFDRALFENTVSKTFQFLGKLLIGEESESI